MDTIKLKHRLYWEGKDHRDNGVRIIVAFLIGHLFSLLTANVDIQIRCKLSNLPEIGC